MIMKSKLLSLAITALLALSFLALIPVAVTPVHAQTDYAPTISPLTGEYTVGQSIALTVSGTSSAGLLNVWLVAMSGPSCLGITYPPVTGTSYTVVSTLGGPVLGSPYAQLMPAFTATSKDTSICAVVRFTDTGLYMVSGVTSFSIVPIIYYSYVNNEQNFVSIDQYQKITLTDYPSGGASPYFFTWYTPLTFTSSTLALAYIAALTATCPAGTTLTAGYGVSSVTVTPAATGFLVYLVQVTDTTIGTPANSICEGVLVHVSLDITSTFTINGASAEIDNQLGAPALTANVYWSGGTGPWYNVVITSNSDYSCSLNTKTVASIDDVNGTQAIFSFPAPTTASTTTYYCATITDSSVGTGSAGTDVQGPIQINTSPALSTPVFALSPTATDYNAPASTMTAKVTWSGGSGPFYVVLTSGSSSNCGLDDTPVTPVHVYDYTGSSTGPYLPVYVTGTSHLANVFTSGGYAVYFTTGSVMRFILNAPVQSTYYCAIVFDSSNPASETATATGTLFTVEPLFAVQTPTLSSSAVEVLTPQYEGFPVTATVTWSGGTGPYDVTLYQGTYADGTTPTCTPTSTPTLVTTTGFNPQTGVNGPSTKFTFLAPNSAASYCYYAVVVDSNGNSATSLYSVVTTPPAYDSGWAELDVATALGTVTLTTAAPGIDAGQTVTVMATVTGYATGGNPPYSITLYTGASKGTCTTKVTVLTGFTNPAVTASPSAIFNFTSPSTAAYFCATVTDGSTPPSVTQSNYVKWTVSTPPSVTLPEGYEIAVGSGTTSGTPLTATGAGGTAPLKYQWFTGDSCAAANAVTSKSTSPSYVTGVISQDTTYSVKVTDSSKGTPALSACASITITVDNGPAGVAAEEGAYAGLEYVANPVSYGTATNAGSLSVVDSDSSTVVTTIPLTADSGACVLSPAMVAVDNTNDMIYVTATVTNPAYVVTAASTFTLAPLAIAGGWIVTDAAQTFTTSMVGMYIYDSTTSSYAQITSLYPPTATTSTQVETTAFSPALPAIANGNGYAVYTAITTPLTTCPYTEDGAGYVAVVNPAYNAEVGSYAVGTNPMGIAVDTKLGYVYVANNGDNTVNVYKLGTAGTLVAFVYTGPGPMMIAVDHSTHTVFVTDNSGNTLTVMQPRTNPPPYFVVSTVNVGSQPIGVAVNSANHNVLVANSGDGTVSVLNGYTYSTIATIKVGGSPQGIDIISGVAYVANMPNTVDIINLATNTPTSVTVGNGPFGVAVDPTDSTVLVTNSLSNTVTIISLTTGQVIRSIVVP